MRVTGIELRVQTTIVCEMQDAWLLDRGLETADSYPAALNARQLAEDFSVDTSFFEGYPHYYELSYAYFVTVDAQGSASNLQLLVARNAFIINQVRDCIRRLEFKPAVKDNQPVISYCVVTFKFNLVPK